MLFITQESILHGKLVYKFTKIKLDYIKDHKLLLLLENNIRGGISGVMGDRYIKSGDKTKIIYIDANNLYGYAMSQYLPTGQFYKLKLEMIIMNKK